MPVGTGANDVYTAPLDPFSLEYQKTEQLIQQVLLGAFEWPS